jgi:transposase
VERRGEGADRVGSYRPGVHVADVARRHGTTRWQIYDWRKRLAKGLLVLSAEVMTPLPFAAVVVEPEERRPSKADPGRQTPRPGSVIELIVDGITIRTGADADEAHLARVIRAARLAAR